MITRCKDMSLIDLFMTLPEIRRYAAEYGAEDQPATEDERNIWLVYSIDDDPIGIINLHMITGCAAQFHPYILRSGKTYYNEMVNEFFGWFMDNAPEEIEKLNVIIPDIYKGALKAANVAKMVTEGVDRKSWLTENGPCDRILLGITRGELCQRS